MVIWAAGLPAADLIIPHMPPIALTACRALLAAAVLLPIWFIVEGRETVLGADWLRGAWVGFITLGLASFFVIIALQFNDPVTVAIVSAVMPVIGILLFCAGVAAYVLYVVAGTGFHMMVQATAGNGNVLVPALAGFGLLCGVVGIGALLALLLDSGLRLLANYARMNYRLLKPKDEE